MESVAAESLAQISKFVLVSGWAHAFYRLFKIILGHNISELCNILDKYLSWKHSKPVASWVANHLQELGY